MRSRTTGAVKLAMAGTYRNGGTYIFPPILGLLILCIYVVTTLWVVITKPDSFNGSLARVIASLRVVLCVNNSLSGRIAVLLLGLATHYRES